MLNNWHFPQSARRNTSGATEAPVPGGRLVGTKYPLKRIARARDFNRIDVDGQRIDVLESALASFESDAIDAVRKVLSARTFPGAAELIALRNPRSRETFNQARSQTLHMLGDLLVLDRRIFESHVHRAAEAGCIADTNVSFESVKKFVEERRYTIEFHSQDNSRIEFEAFDKLLPLLGQRAWSLFLISLAMNTRSGANTERYVFSCLKTFSIKHEGLVREVECDLPEANVAPSDA